ncbi:uncharacterized protein ARMOST_15267 [Armillaria ostoyae]|uniref:Uncharacterized protein n=1 Tax=Armillaria ostoyae TaxID=47428 RepID=A0A284RSW4_ARMOS|nr:uncharacterized protein ARMOST_15267 [Armillaria ostoyae]
MAGSGDIGRGIRESDNEYIQAPQVENEPVAGFGRRDIDVQHWAGAIDGDDLPALCRGMERSSRRERAYFGQPEQDGKSGAVYVGGLGEEGELADVPRSVDPHTARGEVNFDGLTNLASEEIAPACPRGVKWPSRWWDTTHLLAAEEGRATSVTSDRAMWRRAVYIGQDDEDNAVLRQYEQEEPPFSIERRAHSTGDDYGAVIRDDPRAGEHGEDELNGAVSQDLYDVKAVLYFELGSLEGRSVEL